MRVLLYCPLNPKSPRVYAKTLQSILTQEWDGPIEIMFGKQDHVNGQSGPDNLVEKHNHARKIALDQDYDALFFVEADMVIPPDALKRLAALDTDVAYGLYVSRHGNCQWLAFDQIGKNSGKSIDRHPLRCAQDWGKVIETKGVGMGCTLIHRNVLKEIEFTRRGPNADDWYFALDCVEKGFRQHHDLGVVCGHIDKGMIIWPSLETEEMIETESLG